MVLGWLLGRSEPEGDAPQFITADLLTHAENALILVVNDDEEGGEQALSQHSTPVHLLGLACISVLRSGMGGKPEDIEETNRRINAANAVNERCLEFVTNPTYLKDHPELCTSRIYGPDMPYQMVRALLRGLTLGVTLLDKESSSINKRLWAAGVAGRRIICTLRTLEKQERAFMEDVDDPDESDETAECDETAKDNSSNTADSEHDAWTYTPAFAALFADPIDKMLHTTTALVGGLVQLGAINVTPSYELLARMAGLNVRSGVPKLWYVAEYDNLIGTLASVFLLAFNHAAIITCDIVSRQTGFKHSPRHKLTALLERLRARHPTSPAVMLEVRKAKEIDFDFEASLRIHADMPPIKMKLMRVMHVDESAIGNMVLHRYGEAARCLKELSEINERAVLLYLFATGCAHYEEYVKTSPYGRPGSPNKNQDNGRAAQAKRDATKIFEQIRGMIGQNGNRGKPHNYESLVSQYLGAWDERARKHGFDLVDCIGVSPFYHLMYVFCGFRRMGPEQLSEADAQLEKGVCSRGSGSVLLGDVGPEEQQLYELMQCTVARSWDPDLPRFILVGDEFKDERGEMHKRVPEGYYEMAVYEWQRFMTNGPNTIANPELCYRNCIKNLTMAEKLVRQTLDHRAFSKRVQMRIALAWTVIREFEDERKLADESQLAVMALHRVMDVALATADGCHNSRLTLGDASSSGFTTKEETTSISGI